MRVVEVNNSDTGQGQRRDVEHDSTSTTDTSDGMPIYASDLLFRGKKEIVIRHEGSFYRLRITRQGKLILNK